MANVWAFDLATNVGFAGGQPPPDGELSKLLSYTVALRTQTGFSEPDEDVAHRCFNFRTFLKHRLSFREDRPDIVAFEAPLDPNAKPRDGRGRGALEILLPHNLANTLRVVCLEQSIPVVKVWPVTIRTSFIDKPSAGERLSTKKAVIARCKLWGYVPEKCSDDNRCDAVSIWHWTQIAKCGWRPPYEIIMGRRVPVVQRGVA